MKQNHFTQKIVIKPITNEWTQSCNQILICSRCQPSSRSSASPDESMWQKDNASRANHDFRGVFSQETSTERLRGQRSVTARQACGAAHRRRLGGGRRASPQITTAVGRAPPGVGAGASSSAASGSGASQTPCRGQDVTARRTSQAHRVREDLLRATRASTPTPRRASPRTGSPTQASASTPPGTLRQATSAERERGRLQSAACDLGRLRRRSARSSLLSRRPCLIPARTHGSAARSSCSSSQAR